MTRTATAGLAQAAAREFAAHLLPHLPPDLRYTAAMLRRALDLWQAEAAQTAPPDAPLLAAGFGDAQTLAQALRARAAMDPAGLRAALRRHVERKLHITNPRFLEQTRAAGKGLV